MSTVDDDPPPSDRGEGPAPCARELTDEQAAHAFAEHGPNEIPRVAGPSALRRLLSQMSSAFALVLWGAAALAGAAGIPELAIAITVVVVLNATFAFLQEARAGRAAERLRALLPVRVAVRRGGREIDVPAREIVVGDIVCLRAGDRAPADATVLDDSGLTVDMSLLTGESAPAALEAGDEIVAGAFVVEGAVDALVVAVGADTRIAQIAHLTADVPAAVTPLARELQRAVRTIAIAALCAGAVFAFASWVVGRGLSDGLVLGIGVAVALIPEGLLPTVTLALAWGAERLADRHVLVRHLEAVETLGSVTVICTDKTGTLTRNEMTVRRVWTPGGTAVCATPGYGPEGAVECVPDARVGVVAAVRAAMLASVGFAEHREGRWIPHGDRLDVAIDVCARRLGIDVEADRLAARAAVRFPFDARRRGRRGRRRPRQGSRSWASTGWRILHGPMRLRPWRHAVTRVSGSRCSRAIIRRPPAASRTRWGCGARMIRC